jgi:Protein of unknown function (DUF2510)
MAEKPPPAGWYVDPDDTALQRFWDGSRWTNSRMPRTEAVPLETSGAEDEPATRYASDQLAAPEAEVADESGLPPAAWYADPENPSGMRYWDGRQWTEHRTDYLAAPPKPKTSEGMVAAGYITSFMLPMVGVVIGIILMNRDNRHGRWIIGLSVLFFIVFIVISNTADLEQT